MRYHFRLIQILKIPGPILPDPKTAAPGSGGEGTCLRRWLCTKTHYFQVLVLLS